MQVDWVAMDFVPLKLELVSMLTVFVCRWTG